MCVCVCGGGGGGQWKALLKCAYQFEDCNYNNCTETPHKTNKKVFSHLIATLNELQAEDVTFFSSARKKLLLNFPGNFNSDSVSHPKGFTSTNLVTHLLVFSPLNLSYTGDAV